MREYLIHIRQICRVLSQQIPHNEWYFQDTVSLADVVIWGSIFGVMHDMEEHEGTLIHNCILQYTMNFVFTLACYNILSFFGSIFQDGYLYTSVNAVWPPIVRYYLQTVPAIYTIYMHMEDYGYAQLTGYA